MDNPVVHFSTVFMAFFAMMNPLANASMFMGLTDGMDAAMRRRIALRSVIVAFVIVAAFTVGGRQIFSVFGITLPAFRIAGGILIALIGYQMLQGESSNIHTPSADDSEKSKDAFLDMAISPLAIPVLAGPGTIATAMNFAAESTVPQVTRVLVAVGIMCVLTCIAFIGSAWLTRVLGQNVIKVVTRLMGLILTVVGVQMLTQGIGDTIATWPG